MAVAISSELIARMRGLAEATPAREVCGLLLGTADAVEDLLPADNVADDTAAFFEVDPAVQFGAIRAARAGGKAVLGPYHSHPRGRAEPSPRDAAMIGAEGELWIIIAAGEVRAWRSGPGRTFAPVDMIVTGGVVNDGVAPA